MDKIIKLQSRQGGSWTADSQSSNLIDWDIPNDGVYDLSRSNINLSVNIKDPVIGAANGWQDNAGYNQYIVKLADLPQAPVLVPNIVWKAAPFLPIYNATMIKNCSISSEQVGMMEDIRRSDILRQNLFDYTLNEDQKKSIEYSSLRQLQDVDDNLGSIFVELNSGGSETEPLCSNVSKKLSNVDIQIKLKQILELGNVAKYPANKMGKTRVHVELNMDKLTVRYAKQNPGVKQFNDGLNPLKGALVVEHIAAEDVELVTAGIQANANTTSVETGVIDHPIPYYVGQLVRVNQPITIAAGADRIVTLYNITGDLIQALTIANRTFAAGSCAPVTVTLDKAIVNDASFKVLVQGLSGGVLIAEAMAFDKTSSLTKTTDQVFEYIHTCSVHVTLMANGNGPAGTGGAQIGITLGNDTSGINRSFGTISSISKLRSHDTRVRSVRNGPWTTTSTLTSVLELDLDIRIRN